MRAALDSMEDPILHLAVHLTLVGALRAGEIVGLTPEDLDFDAADGIGTFRMQTTKNRKFPPLGNSLLYISLLSVALIASFTSSAILNNLFAICNSRLLPTNQIVNCDGRVRPQGRTLFLFCI